jgi:hypothetical protein
MAETNERLSLIAKHLAWRACRPEYAAQVGAHEYVVRGVTIADGDWCFFAGTINRDGVSRTYPMTGGRYRYLYLGEHRYWIIERILNRARLADVEGG